MLKEREEGDREWEGEGKEREYQKSVDWCPVGGMTILV